VQHHGVHRVDHQVVVVGAAVGLVQQRPDGVEQRLAALLVLPGGQLHRRRGHE